MKYADIKKQYNFSHINVRNFIDAFEKMLNSFCIQCFLMKRFSILVNDGFSFLKAYRQTSVW